VSEGGGDDAPAALARLLAAYEPGEREGEGQRERERRRGGSRETVI
jgi:hypothetical protein